MIKEAQILVFAMPIKLGKESSILRVIIQRLYATSGMLNDKIQNLFYYKIGGTVVAGNEEGIEH